MARYRRFVAKMLSGASHRNVRFSDVRGLLLALGFEERIHGRHHVFSRSSVVEILNLQPRDDGMAKPYQVRQVRDIVVNYKLAEGLSDD